jgi:uncharacterized SAM-binding protein YcdF (DUF218 family)
VTTVQASVRARRGRLAFSLAGVILAAVAILYVLRVPVLRAIGHELVESDRLQHADAMVVLAPGLDRILEAADLYRRGYAPVVLITRERRNPAEQWLIDRGVTNSGEDRRRDVLEKLGVRRDAVTILDGYVGSTADEAREFAEWARQHSIHTVIIVTSPEHTGRSGLTFRRALERLPVQVMMHPSPMGTFRADSWWHDRGTLRDGFTEWQKLVYYRFFELRHLAPVEPVRSISQ